jgi:type IV fimbrial biogenesis protein FimT
MEGPVVKERQRCRGVTLIELCFGVAVVAIVAGLAVPSMRTALRNSAVRSATLELLAGLQQARASSITEARPGVLCLSDPEGGCVTGNRPARAWSAFLEGRGAPPTLLAGGALPRGVELRATRPRLSFWPDSLAASTATLTICDVAGLARPRAVVLSQTGRVRIVEATAEACAA